MQEHMPQIKCLGIHDRWFSSQGHSNKSLVILNIYISTRVKKNFFPVGKMAILPISVTILAILCLIKLTLRPANFPNGMLYTLNLKIAESR